MNLRYTTICSKVEMERNLKEAIASGGIYPGQLVELTSAGADTRYSNIPDNVKAFAQDTVQLQSTASVAAQKAVAIEQDLQGLGVETQMPSGSRLRYIVCEPGDVVNFRFTGSLNIAKGTKLEPDGAGGLKAYTTAGGALFVAEELINPGVGITDLYRIRAL